MGAPQKSIRFAGGHLGGPEGLLDAGQGVPENAEFLEHRQPATVEHLAESQARSIHRFQQEAQGFDAQERSE